MDLKELRESALKEVLDSKNLEELERTEIKYLGRQGSLTEILRRLKDLPIEERTEKGKLANQLKFELESAIARKEKEMSVFVKTEGEKIDITAPGHKLPRGHLHPRTIVLRRVEEIFQSLGFSVVEGIELETDYYNFQALNFPKDHPARDMQDTFKVDEEFLLRTQTSPMQVRYMEKHDPPLRIIVPGRVFRRDATDASHDCQFYQVEGLMVDKHISVANFKAVMRRIFQTLLWPRSQNQITAKFFSFYRAEL